MSDVTVYWRPECGFCRTLERSLGSLRDRAVWRNIWEDEEAREYVARVNGGDEVVPTVVIDGVASTNPNPATVRAALER